MTRMSVIVAGAEPRPAIQLGAVATASGGRGSGAARHLLELALQEADDLAVPVFLFANNQVLDFYPRFGFSHVPCHRVFAQDALLPTVWRGCRRLDPSDAGDREWIIKAAKAARPHGGAFSAMPDAAIIIWHLFNSDIAAYALGDECGIVCLRETEGRLCVAEWLTERDDLELNLLAQAMEAPCSSIEFGFVPRGRSLAASTHAEIASHLFVRKLDLPAATMCFPEMLRT
jgi:hypothetical protein